MKVSDYNRGRSVKDLKLRDWSYGHQIRSDTLYQDDRYNPTKFSHPHRYDNVNFPEQEYIDFFGGNKGEAENKEREHYKLDLN